MKKKRILIIGVSGLLGNALAFYFRDKYEVAGWYSSNLVRIDGVAMRQVNILYEDSLEKAVAQDNPDIIVHCASLTNVDFCERHQELTRLLNTIATYNLVEACKDAAVKFVYISTDSVYDGIRGDFKEDDPVNPQNYYGKSKYDGEKPVINRANSLVLRTNIFGFNIQNKQSIAEWIVGELSQQHTIKGFKDAYFSSIYTVEFARVLEKILEMDLNGLYNCASGTNLSKYEFALGIAQKLNLNTDLIEPITIDDFPFFARRGKNLSMNVEKLSGDLQMELPTIEQGIEEFCEDYAAGRKDQIKNSLCYPSTGRISYGRQCIDDSDIEAVVGVLKSTHLTQGRKIDAFEQELCRYTGAGFAVAVSSGTAALHLACLALGIGDKDEIVTSPITFIASANCAAYCGAKPVFADIDAQTYNIEAQQIDKTITANTKAVIPVHFAGQSCLMEPIRKIIEEKEKRYGRKIYLIEDASHALGSSYRNEKVGSCKYSDMTVMSFHPVKHITTAEGGIIFTNDETLFNKLRYLRSHGIVYNQEEFVNKENAYDAAGRLNPWYYEQHFLGYNYRITDIQCALGSSQLKKLDTFMKRRRGIVDFYNRVFAEKDFLKLPSEHADCLTNWHLYVIWLDFERLGIGRAVLMNALKEKDIHTQVHYIPVHMQPYYQRKFGCRKGDYPNAERYYKGTLSLPLYPALGKKDLDKIVSAFFDILKKGK